MKNFPSLADWLLQQGNVSSKSEAELEALKKSYWSAYHRHYYQHRKKHWKRLTLRLSPQEHQRLLDHASVRCRQLSLNTAIKEFALAYLDEQYVPRDSEAIQTLSQQLQKIGNNINQIVQQLHRTRKYLTMTGASPNQEMDSLQQGYTQLVEQVAVLKQDVQGYFHSPPLRLDIALWELVRDQPEKVEEVRNILDKIEKATGREPVANTNR